MSRSLATPVLEALEPLSPSRLKSKFGGMLSPSSRSKRGTGKDRLLNLLEEDGKQQPEAEPSGCEVKILFLDGRTIVIRVRGEDTVKSVRATISQVTGIRMEAMQSMKLVCDNQVMLDCYKLHNYMFDLPMRGSDIVVKL
eukprot:TRINITY_DN11978_c0_g1_i1.p2 TRINITY_DN11978_c0_g1~~TRINITY_DN11978_c0_g1_i1.p2  ORF type:complete len:140 (+),score=31.12 TRINITY_DN11978_c0_g1_i1:277-696(+)